MAEQGETSSFGFAYLNPHIRDTSSSNDTLTTVEPWHFSLIPQNFNGEEYLLSNVNHPDIPVWNRHILQSMLDRDYAHGGLTQCEADAVATAMPTIGQLAHALSIASEGPPGEQAWTVTFKFNDPSFEFGHSAVQKPVIVPGDVLRVQTCITAPSRSTVFQLPRDAYVTVKDVLPDSRSIVVLAQPPDARTKPFDEGKTYSIIGHRLYDAQRLASVIMVRSTQLPSCAMPNASSEYPHPHQHPHKWSSNAAAEALRVGAWCSNAMAFFAETEMVTLRLDAMNERLHAIASSCVTRSLDGIVSGIVELEAGTLVVANDVIARGKMTLGTPFDRRPPVCLDVHGSIRAEDYVVASDVRTKSVVAPLNVAACAEAVTGMVPVRYSTILSPSAEKYGFVAQDLMRLDEHLVRCCRDFVPSIMEKLDIDYKGRVALRQHGLVVGNKLLAMSDDAAKWKLTVRQVPDPDSFYVDGQSFAYGKKDILFVGKEVDDFHTIDQGNLVAVLAGALRNALNRIDALENKMSSVRVDEI